MPKRTVSNVSSSYSMDNIQIALAPHIQTYLSQTARRRSCCSVMLPVAFERAAAKSWFNPHFDSAVLEGQFLTSVFPQIRMRFRCALFYILLCSATWFLYFLNKENTNIFWDPLAWTFGFMILVALLGIGFTYSDYYHGNTITSSAVSAILLCGISLASLAIAQDSFSPLGQFAICLEIILLIYTVLPMPLWMSVGIAVLYSILFESLTHILVTRSIHQRIRNGFCYKVLILRILLQISVHLIGLHILLMNIVRMRGMFMKVGQNLMDRRQLEMEKQLKEKMIHSVMPPKVANLLLNETGGVDSDNMSTKHRASTYYMQARPSNDVKSLFRPFHMHSMENVSILFADIVGFTKMSSTKTAEQLVEILNDLFERFDDLCCMNNCEKISTLGDCYYCVSGCPEPRSDHAVCCVEMGLGMIDAIRVFDAQRHEGIKMRVGVHTGTVLCGIVGTRRVKFDVWSNDVTLANKMESTGKPEKVHISEETCNFIGDTYTLEDGGEVFGHRTFFVICRRENVSISNTGSFTNLNAKGQQLPLTIKENDNLSNEVSISQSATNISVNHPLVPLVSPVHSQLQPINIKQKILQTRQNVKKNKQVIMDYPKIVITTKSLPGSLDSVHEKEGSCQGSSTFNSNGDFQNYKNEDECKTNRYAFKLKILNVPKFLKKLDDLKRPELLVKPKNLEENTLVEQNGYQQLPVVIETAFPSAYTLDIPQKNSTNNHIPISKSQDSYCSPSEHLMFDNIIDIRSYISQSRSDISPFSRSASYRSQCSKLPSNSDVSQNSRPRSSTLATKSDIQQVRKSTNNWPDSLSICPSATSRKDSGIKSNSRRSSIQQQIYALNQSTISQNRVSGYFTSSVSSLSNISDAELQKTHKINQTPKDPLAACLQQLRKQSDLQLIRCVRDNAKSQRSYLVKPPLNRFSLFFKDRQMEHEFRSKAHRFGNENETEGPPTFATPRYNTYIDIFIGIIVYLVISASLFLVTPANITPPFRIWVSVFALFTTVHFFALFLFTRQICRTHSINNTKLMSSTSCTDKIFDAISSWYPWHICLSVLMFLPVISIIVNFSLIEIHQNIAFKYQYGFLIFACIVHFCNFTQLNCWMRNILALLAGICFIGIVVEQITTENNQTKEINITETLNVPLYNFSKGDKWFQIYHIEIYLDLILFLMLVWFINREFEVGYRLIFYGNAVANQDKIRVQNMKNQADMLLHNIIPKYVAEQLKNTAKYSENHRKVAIIFASIVNFNEMYDESYLGGKEYLRVLNELIGDFDELLTRPMFRCVEKIKTIGSSFMAASGLDPSSRGDDNEHIHALMEFSLAMQSVVDAFNKDLLEFNLILRIGFNVGDVTAGVIGTSKLHYDIWGDAVNVASRMDSTGVDGRIQVGKDCLKYLELKYEFEPRGEVYVKGKDHMEVYLFKAKKPDLVYSES